MKMKYLNRTFLYISVLRNDTFIAGGYTWARELLRK